VDPGASGHGKHSRVEVGCDDGPALAYPLGREPRDDACATGDIEHALPGLRIREADDSRRPRPEHGGNEVVLVHLGRAAGHLPLAFIDRHVAERRAADRRSTWGAAFSCSYTANASLRR
jgi:hypothetical protein